MNAQHNVEFDLEDGRRVIVPVGPVKVIPAPTTPPVTPPVTTPPVTTPPVTPPPSSLALPTVQAGWKRLPVAQFNVATAFGTNPSGWYGPYSFGTGDTANRRGNGKGEWVNAKTVMVGPGTCPIDNLAVPANVLDICQHLENGIPYSAVLLPDLPNYNANQGSTQEWISFIFRVLKPGFGWKMVPLLWNDSDTGNEEIDLPEIEFGPGTSTLALHFPSGDYQVPYFGYFNDKLGYSYTTGNYGLDLAQWTFVSQRRTVDSSGVGHLALWLSQSPIDISTAAPVFACKDGDTFTQWGASHTVTVPKTSMHWVLQTETSTLGGNNQPAAGSVDHVQFLQGVAIDVPA